MKKRAITLILGLMLAAVPLLSLAGQVYVPEQGVSIDFPGTVDVLYRGMNPDDPVLSLYNKTADEVTAELKSSGLYALAYDIASNFTVKVGIKGRSEPSFGEMDENRLTEYAGRFGGSEYEVFQAGRADFLLIYGDSGRALVALCNKGGVQVELRLMANGKITPAMVKTMKDLAGRTSLPQSQ